MQQRLSESKVITNFESKAEEVAYSLLREVCEKHRWHLDYQVESKNETHYGGETDYRDWVIDKYPYEIPFWIENHDCRESQGNHGCRYCYTTDEFWVPDFRIDFVLSKFEIKIALEIDSKKWHTDDLKDFNKDEKMKAEGYKVVRVMAAEVLYHPLAFQKRIEEILTEEA